MRIRNNAVRLVGALLMAVALAPWVGGSAAQAAVTVHLDKKWIGTSAADAALNHAGCAYDEIKTTHTGTGWHFVLPGGDGLSSFTAYFQTAGAVTVTTVETASGVIVQDGHGAVIYTPTADTLVAAGDGYPGIGTAETAGENDMQLSHICTGTPPPPPVTTTPPPTTSSAPASVLPTTASATPETSVEGTKSGRAPNVLPKTGSGLPLGVAIAISLGLLLGGAALLFVPRRLALDKGQHRRH